MNEPLITSQDKENYVWKKLMAHWEKQLLKCRQQLEKDQNEIITAKIRGQITEIKANMRLAEPANIIE